MQDSMQIFLALLLAHLLGDFVVQRRAIIDAKRAGAWWALAERGAWHLVCLVAAWWLFAPGGVGAGPIALAFAVVVSGHLLTDLLNHRLSGDRAVTAFLLDQAAHLALLLAVAWWLAGWPDWFQALADAWRPHADSLGWLAVAYLVVVVMFGWLNRLALQSLLPGPDGDDGDGVSGERAGLARAGLYIGWLERFLMFSAVLINAWSVLGLVLAAKSVFRFDSIRNRREHTEYFVIGTLLSVSEVMAVGLGFRWLSSTLTGGI